MTSSTQLIELSIVICNYNTADFLKRCLDNIIGLNIQIAHEIIIVDNNSPDDSLPIVRANYPKFKLIANTTNRWLTGGFNDGMRQAQGQWVCILAPDVFPQKGSLETMIDYLQLHTDTGMVSCKTFLPDNTMVRACSKDYSLTLAFLTFTFLGKIFRQKKYQLFEDFRYNDWDRMSSREVELVYAHLILFRKEALEQAGYFDENFKLYFSENDLCRRFLAKGWKTAYVSSASVYHHERQSVERSGVDKIAKIYEEDIYAYYRKYYGVGKAACLAFLIYCSSALLSIKNLRPQRMLTLFLIAPKPKKN